MVIIAIETHPPSASETRQRERQMAYWKRYENAQIQIKSGIYHSEGIRACLDLLKHNDLAMMLKARVNLTVAEYGDIMEMPDKMRYLDTCFSVIDQMEKRQLPNDKTLMGLRKHAEDVKKEIGADVEKERKKTIEAQVRKAMRDDVGEKEGMISKEPVKEEKKHSDGGDNDSGPRKSRLSFFRRR